MNLSIHEHVHCLKPHVAMNLSDSTVFAAAGNGGEVASAGRGRDDQLPAYRHHQLQGGVPEDAA